MARPKTPTNILEMKGAFKKNPNRRRVEEPKQEKPLGNPPTRLAKSIQKIWREIAKQCAPGVLTYADRQAMELVSIAILRVRKNYGLFDDDGNHILSMSDIKTALTMLGQFGLTPATRASLGVAKK